MGSTAQIRYDIVFLRCIAILAVICYHFKLPLLKDGYAGVDIFFVISGYLITAIIGKNDRETNVNLLDFFYRRLAKILPPLLGLIFVFSVLIGFILPFKLYDFGRFAFASSLFFSNIYYYLGAGYFMPSSQLNFLLHTWSLSLELQFYVSYPLLLLLFRWWNKRKKVPLSYFIYVLAGMSVILMYCCGQKDQSLAFYMYPTRLWEFCIGALAFVYRENVFVRFSIARRNMLGAVFLGMLIFSISGILSLGKMGWPSFLTIIPTVCTGIIICIAPDISLFKNRFIVFIAKISYSWYLWHWPIIVFATYLSWPETLWSKLAYCIGSFFLSVIAYTIFEQNRILRKPKIMLISALTAIGMVYSFTQIFQTGFPLDKQLAKLYNFYRNYPTVQAPSQFHFGQGHLLASADFGKVDTNLLLQFSDSLDNYLLLGDCHAGMFSHTLMELAQKNNVNLLQATGDETFPAPNVTSLYAGPEQLVHYLYESYLPMYGKRIKKVILMANYVDYTKAQLETYLRRVQGYFRPMNIPVVYIGQTESYTIEYPIIESLRLKFGVNPTDYLVPSRRNVNEYMKKSPFVNAYIDLYQSPDIQQTNAKETYLYDADHFSIFGTNQYAAQLEEVIFLDK
ncbi:acyltransferase family protein [Sphingobacterium sp. LRF_L2]|uniref:acyltransferase family protein n=1 Tax=Sphingobacterium sp. LRF_L2 TaxID=3369421 RepID=UPI003F5EF9B6